MNKLWLKLKEKLPLILSAFFLSFTVCLYAPISIYIVNKQDLWFGLRSFIHVSLLFFLIAFSFLVLIGIITNNRLFNIILGLVFAVGLCLYLQGNLLCLKLGILNGANIPWQEYKSKMLLNLVIWLVIIICTLVVILWKTGITKRVIMFLSASLSLMQIVSLIALMIPVINQGEFDTPTSQFMSNQGLYEVGDEDNIIVILLDAFDESNFLYLQANEPELLEDFEGFVYYNNYTGLYPFTKLSIVNFMNGRVFRNEMPLSEWIENNQEPLYFDELINNGYEIAIYEGWVSYIPKRIVNTCTNFTTGTLRFYNWRSCFAIIYRLVACQYFPDIVKPYAWMDDTFIDSTSFTDAPYPRYTYSNEDFKYFLDQNGISVKKHAKEYKFIHLWGAHEPYYIDEWGNATEEHFDHEVMRKGCTRIVADYLNHLKESGAYDNSTIIITADHGYNGDLGLLDNPVFLMKEKNSRGTIRTCNYEVSQEDFGATIADLCGAKDVAQYGRSILNANEETSFDRYIYSYIYNEGNDPNPIEEDGNYYLVEYSVPKDNNDPAQFRLTDVEYLPSGDRISHAQYCQSCQQTGGVAEPYMDWNRVYRLQHVHVKDFHFPKD